jgi:hypothetical protein
MIVVVELTPTAVHCVLAPPLVIFFAAREQEVSDKQTAT